MEPLPAIKPLDVGADTNSSPRNLILCLDGTNNEFSEDNTNVVKLYSMIDQTRPDQLAYYQPGIGTSVPPGVWGHLKRKVFETIDLATAWFLSTHVIDAYRYLQRFYRDGDRIYIFGFSRGAYTARAVAAMLHKVGLLTQGNEELLPFAYSLFEKRTADNQKLADEFKTTFSRTVEIHFLGIWDTVSSVGWVWNPKILPHTSNNPSVRRVRHALALDERRAFYRPNVWGNVEPTEVTDVLELWFAGVHSDIGGGYPEEEAGLSAITLQWMVEEASAAGLHFNKERRATVLVDEGSRYALPDPKAKLHTSLKGWWWLLELYPKHYKGNVRTWGPHLGRRRTVEEVVSTVDPETKRKPQLHWSVRERVEAGIGYKPPNLPKDYEQLLWEKGGV